MHEVDFHQAVGHFAVAFDQVEHASAWSKQSQIGPRLGHDERHVRPHHRQHGLALRPLDAMERHQRPPRPVDGLSVSGGVLQRLVLEAPSRWFDMSSISGNLRSTTRSISA